MTGAGVGIEGSKVRSQKRASRVGIQPTKPIGPLESTDVKKDGTIADLKPRLAPKPPRPRRHHARLQHERGSLRVHIASRTFPHRPLWESSWCLRGSLVFVGTNPGVLYQKY